MHRDFPPLNPDFAAGVTYGTHGRIEKDLQHVPSEQQVRDIGGAAARTAVSIGPGFLKSVHDRVVEEADRQARLEQHIASISDIRQTPDSNAYAGEASRQAALEAAEVQNIINAAARAGMTVDQYKASGRRQ